MNAMEDGRGRSEMLAQSLSEHEARFIAYREEMQARFGLINLKDRDFRNPQRLQTAIFAR